jgi:hypothetical protein
MVVEEEIQTKGTENLLNRIIAVTSLTSRKRETPKCRKFTEHQTIRTTKRDTLSHIIIQTLSIQNIETILKAAKERRQVT